MIRAVADAGVSCKVASHVVNIRANAGDLWFFMSLAVWNKEIDWL